MKQFKVGDRVKLNENSEWNNGYISNPIDITGTISKIYDRVVVDWDNHTYNSYKPDDLYYSDEIKTVLYMVGSKTLVDNETIFATETEAKLQIAKVEIEPINHDYKEVVYLGNRLVVPAYTRYIATDKAGSVHAYVGKPVLEDHPGCWLLGFSGDTFKRVGKIISSNIDWKDSCQKV